MTVIASPVPQITTPPQALAEVVVNENFAALGHALVYAYAYQTSSGLTWGYYGGRWSGFSVAAGTLALTLSATNYVVVERATGAISVATTTTNWNNTTDYARVYKIVAGASTVTSAEDHRAGESGIGGGGSGGGGGGGTAGTLDFDTDGTLAANSDAKIATQKAVVTYVAARITASLASADVMIYKGGIDCSANPNYPAADAGAVYIVSVAGKIGGASGITVEAGDIAVCKTDSTASGNQATVGAQWDIVQTNLIGAALTSGTLAQFAATTSAQLLALLTDPTGTGVAVFATSPALAGNPTAPTQTLGNNSTRIATTAFVAAAVAAAGGGDALTSGTLAQFAATTSAELRGVISDETGTGGGLVFATGPTLTNPIVGTQSPGDNSTKAASTAYADAAVAAALAGLSWKQAVRVATTANGTLATAFENGDTVDGVTLATGDRILLKNQSTASQNGIYVVAASGSPTRATDADSGAELVNASVYVSEGTANADTQWVCTTNAPITVGSTSITFAQFSAGGPVAASSVTVTDSGNYYTGADVEAILQEIGAALAAAGGSSLGTPAVISATLVRPANTSAYASGQIVANATSGSAMLTFTNVALANGGAFNLKKAILKDSATNASGANNIDFVLRLYTAALATPLNDRANFDLTDPEVLTEIAIVEFYGQSSVWNTNITAGEGVGASGGRIIYANGLDDLLICGGSTRNIYGILEVLNAISTSVSAESYQIDLVGFQLS